MTRERGTDIGVECILSSRCIPNEEVEIPILRAIDKVKMDESVLEVSATERLKHKAARALQPSPFSIVMIAIYCSLRQLDPIRVIVKQTYARLLLYCWAMMMHAPRCMC